MNIMLTSLYIHIPFCKHICTYCDFHKEIATLEKKKAYVDALLEEIDMYKDKVSQLKTIYIGGGTPSNLELTDLKRLFQKLSSIIDTATLQEYTIEVNPDDMTYELAKVLSTYHINRVSMGVQTFHQKHLAFLNRTHNKEDVLNAISVLKKNHIKNINIDMIFNIPNQTIKELEEDIEIVTSLPIKHISYYSLILEEKSVLYQLIKKNKVTISDQDLEADMYIKVMDTLQNKGFIQYEISNFCKEGYESIHNLSYWTNKEYLGLGSGSHSMMDNKRLYNVSNVSKYVRDIANKNLLKEEYEHGHIKDVMITGLRLTKGINIQEVNKLYNLNILELYNIPDFINNNILEIKGEYLRFTKQGILIGNVVFLEIMEG